MTLAPVSRRTVIASGAAAGGLALAGGWTRAGAASTAEMPPPASGAVALWTRFACDGGASFRLVQLDAQSRPVHELAAATLGADRVASVAQVHAEARSFAVAAVARSWGVAPAACRIDARMIAHPGGRSVRYVAWTDFV